MTARAKIVANKGNRGHMHKHCARCEECIDLRDDDTPVMGAVVTLYGEEDDRSAATLTVCWKCILPLMHEAATGQRVPEVPAHTLN